MNEKIRIVSLNCWHANGLIYQANGRTDDGKHVFVHARGTRFTVWVGDSPYETYESNEGRDVFFTDTLPHTDTGTVTLATLKEWTRGRDIEWPDHIDGYDNEPGG